MTILRAKTTKAIKDRLSQELPLQRRRRRDPKIVPEPLSELASMVITPAIMQINSNDENVARLMTHKKGKLITN